MKAELLEWKAELLEWKDEFGSSLSPWNNHKSDNILCSSRVWNISTGEGYSFGIVNAAYIISEIDINEVTTYYWVCCGHSGKAYNLEDAKLFCDRILEQVKHLEY